jgi:hypothetical protein
MRRFLAVSLALVLVLFFSSMAMAYTINDSPANDSIGFPEYETYGINVLNFTPGVNSGPITMQIFTNFPQSGITVNGSPPWATIPADVFITENYQGIDYLWAVPLVNHGAYSVGNMYAVGTALLSNDLDPSGGTGYIYNPNVNVQIATTGSNYGFSSFGGGSVSWIAQAGSPDWMVNVALGIFEDDPFSTMSFLWGTATCANDVVFGQVGGGGEPNVPIPSTVLLLGSGLVGLVGLRQKRKFLLGRAV